MTLLMTAAILDFALRRRRPLTRRAFQKVLYFAQLIGWQSHFRFRLGTAGPFSSEAAAVLESLAAIGAVTVTGSNLSAGPALKEILRELRDARLTEVLKKLDPLLGMSTEDLDLLATVHFIFESDRKARLAPQEDSVVAEVRQYEGARHGDDQIRKSMKQLNELALLGA
jgi:hypothetical protein